MSITNDNWFRELFINEAKPALERHSGTGGGSSSGTGNDSIVVDVEALPTENINNSRIYRTIEEIPSGLDVWIVNSQAGANCNFVDFYTTMTGGQLASVATYELVDALPSDPVITIQDTNTKTIYWHIYIIRDTGECWSYVMNLNNDMNLSSEIGGGAKGFITDPSQAVEDGMYVVSTESDSLIVYGIPNSDGGKKLFEYGTEWVDTGAKIADLQESVDGLTSEVTALTDENSTLTSQVDTLTSEKTSLTSQVNTLRSQNSTLTSQVDTLKSEKATLTSQVNTLSKENATFNTKIASLNEDDTGTIVFAKYALFNTSDTGVTFTGVSDKSITKITLPDIVTNIETVGAAPNISCNVFSGCLNLASVNVLASVSDIPPKMFYGLTSLANVMLHEGITSINMSAFEGCAALKSIDLPSTATNIQGSAFKDCTSLEEIEIPQGVDGLYANVFNGCTNLHTITIPGSVYKLYAGALANCPNLVTINFGGTKANWKSISKGSGWISNTSNYTVYCTDGTIAKDGTET